MVAQLIIDSPRTTGSAEREEWSEIRARVVVPDDDEIALCRIALATLSRGTSRLALNHLSAPVRALIDAASLLGSVCDYEEVEHVLSVRGCGLDGMTGVEGVIDVRGHSNVAALLVGLCVSRSFETTLWVDVVVAQMLVPALGEVHEISVSELIEDDGGGVELLLPSTKSSDLRVEGLRMRDSGVFAWVKQAALLAGLRSGGPTVFEEELASGDHLERALLRSKCPIQGDGSCITLHPPRDADALAPQVYDRVGSIDYALWLIAAATGASAGQLAVRDVALNPSRTVALSALRSAGFEVRAIPEGDRQGEPVGQIIVAWDKARSETGLGRRAVAVSGENAVRLGDQLLALSAIAATMKVPWSFEDFLPQARGSDARIRGRALGLLRSAGAAVEETEQAFRVSGPEEPLRGLRVTTGGDIRLALLGTALSLRAQGPSTIDNVDCLRDGFPKWVGTLRALGAKIEVRHEDD